MFDRLVGEYRTHSTESLRRARREAVREQRRWRMRELAVTRVLDERGQVDDSLAQDDGVSVRKARDTRETARALDRLPAIGDAAARGELSDEQLSALAKLADAGSDREWASKGARCSPEDLRQKARTKEKPTAADGAARRATPEQVTFDHSMCVEPTLAR